MLHLGGEIRGDKQTLLSISGFTAPPALGPFFARQAPHRPKQNLKKTPRLGTSKGPILASTLKSKVGKVGPKSEGGLPEIWPESALRSSNFDENRCNRRFWTPRDRMVPAEPNSL